ncbi:MAG: hypothetical protein JXO22_06615, partial [Phycisphaerae bacterium]|nr:hypothetical protein [Phycisphaerae bacterium]
MPARNLISIVVLSAALFATLAPAYAQTTASRAEDTPDGATLLQDSLNECEATIKDLDAEISELRTAVQADDPSPQDSITYNAQRLKLAGLVAERACLDHNRETLKLALRWHAGERELQHDLAWRLMVANLENTEEELAQVADGPQTNPEHPVSIWQAAFLEVVPTPVWASSGGRSRDTATRVQPSNRGSTRQGSGYGRSGRPTQDRD